MKLNRRDSGLVEVVGLLGVGFDGDGDVRVTEFEDDMLVLGGSAETHERMADTMARLTEALERRGKRLRQAHPDEVADLLRDARQKH